MNMPAHLREAVRLLSRAGRASVRPNRRPNGLSTTTTSSQDRSALSRQHLASKFSRDCRSWSEGQCGIPPRPTTWPWTAISHTDGQVDYESLERLFAAYQSIALLKLGELWSIPIISVWLDRESPAVAVRVMGQQRDQDQSEAWADRMLGAYRESFGAFLQAVGEMTAVEPAISPALFRAISAATQRSIPHDNVAIRWVTQCLPNEVRRLRTCSSGQSDPGRRPDHYEQQHHESTLFGSLN